MKRLQAIVQIGCLGEEPERGNFIQLSDEEVEEFINRVGAALYELAEICEEGTESDV